MSAPSSSPQRNGAEGAEPSATRVLAEQFRAEIVDLRRALHEVPEYDLDLPTSGDSTTPATNASSTTDDDDGGFPVLVIIIVGAAAVAVGLGVWRLQVGRRMDDLDDN